MVSFDAEGAGRLFQQLNRCLFCCSELSRSARKQNSVSVTQFNEVWNHLVPQEDIEFLETPPVCSNCGETLEKLYTALVQLTERTLEIRKTITESSRNGKYSEERFSKLLDLGGDGVDDKCRRGALSLLERLGHEEVFEEDYQSWFLKENIEKVEGIETISTDGHGDEYAGQSDSKCLPLPKDVLPVPEKGDVGDTFSSNGDSDDGNDRESDSDYSPDDDLPAPVISSRKEKSRKINLRSGRRLRSKRLTEQSKTKIKDDDEEEFDDDAGNDDSDFEPEGSRRQKKTRWSSMTRSYSCRLCHENIPLENLGEHVRSHVGDYALPCPNPDCQRVFLTLPELNYHIRMMNNCKCFRAKGIYSCSSCDFKGSNNLSLFKHLLSAHKSDETSFSCPVANCSESFSTRQTVQCHLSLHAPLAHRSLKDIVRDPRRRAKLKLLPRLKSKLISCDFCMEPVSPDSLEDHVRSHVGEYALPCHNRNCNRIFATFPQLTIHLSKSACNKHRLPNILTCELCEFRARNSQNLSNHFNLHHDADEKKFSCPVTNCPESFPCRQAVQFHIRQHALLSPLSVQKCSDCGEKLPPDRMRIHLEAFHELKPEAVVSCSQCPFLCSSWESLLNHFKVHFGVKVALSCPLCGEEGYAQVFRRLTTLRDHFWERHKIGTPIICDLCPFTCWSAAGLVNHAANSHGPPNLQKEPSKKKFNVKHLIKCSLCPKTYKNTSFLVGHTIRDHGAPKMECHLCGEKFTYPHLFNRHKRNHAGIKRNYRDTERNPKPKEQPQGPFPCTLCGEEFPTKGLVKDHKNLVHGGKHMECNVCRRTVTTRELKNHQLTKLCRNRALGMLSNKTIRKYGRLSMEGAEGRSFTAPSLFCEKCGKEFFGKCALKGHLEKVHSEETFQCEICGRKFKCWDSFRVHKARKGVRCVNTALHAMTHVAATLQTETASHE